MRPLRVLLVTPAPPGSHHGNRVTAARWAGLLRSLDHRVRVREDHDGAPLDLLVALHARKSAAAVRRVRAEYPAAGVVLALTGTDLYPSLEAAGVDPAVLATADRLVVLQPLAVAQLPPSLRGRVRVIHQSVKPRAERRYHAVEPAPWGALPPYGRPPGGVAPPPGGTRCDHFPVAMLAHLRGVKDPLLPAGAVRLLPATSHLRVWHAGAVIDPDLGDRAAVESRANDRYTWLGQLTRAGAARLLASTRAVVHPSRHEGGANVVSEALAAGVPILASRIPGTVGILGADYPGYFPPGDAVALAALFDRAERNADGLYDRLCRHCAALGPLTDPRVERASWRRLIAELRIRPGVGTAATERGRR